MKKLSTPSLLSAYYAYYFPLIEFFANSVYNQYMLKYFSHYTAAMKWDIPYIDVVLGQMADKADTPSITVSDYNQRFSINGKKIHACKLTLPPGAVKILDGEKVASPELLFLELASELCIHRLILLGLQLCSHPLGSPSSAITTKQKLSTFLAKTSGHRGHRKAMRAAMYLENGSRSIMESLAFMIFTLPHALGGYGLKGAVFNHEIRLKDGMKAHLGQNCCFVDLYYIKAKVAVEYDSFTFHKRPSEQGKDAIRSAILERQGIDVMHLNTIQLYDRNACMIFAKNLAARLGKRIEMHTSRFDEMHTMLRALLPENRPELRDNKSPLPETKPEPSENKPELPESKPELPENKSELPENKSELPESLSASDPAENE